MMTKSVVGFAGLVLASAAGCSVATDGSETSGLAEESLSGCHDSGTRFYVPAPNPGAKDQIKDLKKHHQKQDAALIQKMIETPQAVWLTQASPKDVKKATKKVMRDAADQGATPVLVPYNIPFRDCAQFSAGGATTKQEYFDWIEAVAKGIGDGDAIVILEPDSLGIIPFYNPFASRDDWLGDEHKNDLEWCQPADADPATAAADRFEMLSYAVDVLKANPGTKVYLDGTHNAWLGAGDAADRLVQANVAAADGFFLDASNYQSEAFLDHYGKWVAQCAWFADSSTGSWGAGHAEWCNSQYYPASPDDLSTWGLTDAWYTANVESQGSYPGDAGIKHFVVDTSRNGVGPWAATPEQQALGDDQDWCNPPDRALGLRPTSQTGNAVIDAYLWIKIPGESDGQCNRWEPSGSPDPVRGMMDPAAGAWFPEMALELAKNAKPAL